MPIYTKTGDDGTTAIYGGKRIVKSDPQVEVYGSIDELNSVLGLAISTIPKNDKMQTFFHLVQEDLMSIGSVLAGWEGDISHIEERVERMEKYIDEFEKMLPPLHQFILPGGSICGSHLHFARCVCRRTERTIVRIIRNHVQYTTIVRYLNRLSDLCFVYARYINKKDGENDLKWKIISTSRKGKRKVV